MKPLLVRRWSSPIGDVKIEQISIDYEFPEQTIGEYLNFVIAPPEEFASKEYGDEEWIKKVNKILNQKFDNSFSDKGSKIEAYLSETHRIFYINHDSKSSSWLPLSDDWSALQNHSQLSIDPGSELEELSTTSLSSFDERQELSVGLPYGWEEAIDDFGRHYYINHLNCSTTYELPHRRQSEESRNSKTTSSEESDETFVQRKVTLHRPSVFDQFGFVIGSQKPSIIKFVQPDGPSEKLLSIGDRILEVNGASVSDATRQHIIALFRASGTEVTLTVGQPNKINKSSILTITKRAKLRENPRRVRFVESVMISGSPLYEVEHPLDEYRDSIKQMPKTNSESDSIWNSKLFSFRSSGKMNCSSSKPYETNDDNLKKIKSTNNISNAPFVNVLKIFLENGQTKTFKYDGQTTIQNIIDIICEKQNILQKGSFCIVAESVRNLGTSKRNFLLDNREKIVNIVTRPDAHSLRCLFRLAFPPLNPTKLLGQDPSSFDYLYEQCANDIVLERTQPDILYETAIHLSALKVLEYSFTTGILIDPKGKILFKKLEDDVGISRFVPKSLVLNMKTKELIRLLEQTCRNIQSNETLTDSRQVRIRFLSLYSELPCYGAFIFTNLSTRPKSSTNATLNVSKKVPQSESKKFQQYQQQQLNFPDVSNQILSSPRAGLCLLQSPSTLITGAGLASSTVTRIENIERIVVSPQKDSDNFNVQIFILPHLNLSSGGVVGVRSLRDEKPTQIMQVLLNEIETEEFLLVTRNYHKLLNAWSSNLLISDSNRHSRNDTKELTSHKKPYRPIECIWETPTDNWWIDGAPQFYGPHSVVGAGWNYPHFKKQRVDFAVPPPRYGTKTEFLKNRLALPEVIASSNACDSILYNDSSDVPEKAECIDMPSVVSFEILENVGKQNLNNNDKDDYKMQNSDVLYRVSEMNRILKDAERYLLDQQQFSLLESQMKDSCRDSYMSDIFPQLLKAETDLLDMMRSLNAEPNGNENLKLDLESISPPKTPEKMLDEKSNNFEQAPPTPYKNSSTIDDDASQRIVAELDSLFITLNRMKNNFNDDLPQVQTQTSPNNVVNESDKRTSNDSQDLMLNSFDHLTESINQLVAQMEQCSTQIKPNILNENNQKQEQFMSNLVLPPPPPPSNFASDHNVVVEQFWRATEDLKRICTSNKNTDKSVPNYYENLSPTTQSYPFELTSNHEKLTSSLSADEVYVRELAQRLLAQHAQQEQQKQKQNVSTNFVPVYSKVLQNQIPNNISQQEQQQQQQQIGRSQSLQVLSGNLTNQPFHNYYGLTIAATPSPTVCSFLQAQTPSPQDTVQQQQGVEQSQSQYILNLGTSSSSSSLVPTPVRSMTLPHHSNYSPKPPLPPQNSQLTASSTLNTNAGMINQPLRHNHLTTQLPNTMRHAHVVKQLSAPPMTQFHSTQPQTPFLQHQQQQQSTPPPPYSFSVNTNSNMPHSPFLSSATPSPTSSTSGSAAFTTIASNYTLPLNYAVAATAPQIPESKRVYFQGKEIAEIFAQSQLDIDCLLARLEDAHENRLTKVVLSNTKINELDSLAHREALALDARHFITASKFFVKCANEASFQILDYLAECIALLGRMFAAAEEALFQIGQTSHVTCLVDRLKECAATFAYTVDTVHRLLSFPETIQEPNPYSTILGQHTATLTMNLNTLLRTLNLS